MLVFYSFIILICILSRVLSSAPIIFYFTLSSWEMSYRSSGFHVYLISDEFSFLSAYFRVWTNWACNLLVSVWRVMKCLISKSYCIASRIIKEYRRNKSPSWDTPESWKIPISSATRSQILHNQYYSLEHENYCHLQNELFNTIIVSLVLIQSFICVFFIDWMQFMWIYSGCKDTVKQKSDQLFYIQLILFHWHSFSKKICYICAEQET